MPRRRMIDPKFWLDEGIGSCSKGARLLFLGLVSLADDEGRLTGSARALRAQVFAFDDDESAASVGALLDELTAACRSIVRYEVDGRPYIQLRNWTRYQRIEKGYASELPPPPGWTEPAPTDRVPLRQRRRSGSGGDAQAADEGAARNVPGTVAERSSQTPDRSGKIQEASRQNPAKEEVKEEEEEEEKKSGNSECVSSATRAHAHEPTEPSTPAARPDPEAALAEAGRRRAAIPPDPDAHPLFETFFAKIAEACFTIADPRLLPVKEQTDARKSAGECIRLGVRPESIDLLLAGWTRGSPPYPSQIATEALRAQDFESVKSKAKATGARPALASGEVDPSRQAGSRTWTPRRTQNAG